MPPKVLISGGGTGGHIFPAIAIANELKHRHPEAEILFVGANGKMEMEKVPAAGYEIIGLNITGIRRSLSLDNLAFPFKLLTSLIKSRGIIKSFKPDVVVGVGGFASGPVLRMATWMGVPSLIQEQNSFAGITNRWVASSVSKACVAYDNMERFFPKDRIVLTGNPVRKEVVDVDGKKAKAIQHFGLLSDKKTVLVVGGSLGARSINLALEKHIEKLLDAKVQVIWQTGKLFQESSGKIKTKYQGKGLFISEFIYEMDLAYAAADVVVSRAGAIAVSELCLVGKPCLLVPFPFAAEDHQTMNARALESDDAAILIPDKVVQDELVPQLLALISDDAKQQRLRSQILKHGKPNATADIVNEVLGLIND